MIARTNRTLEVHGVRYTWHMDRNDNTYDAMYHWYWLFTPATSTVVRAVNPNDIASVWAWHVMVPLELSTNLRTPAAVYLKGQPFYELERDRNLTKRGAIEDVEEVLKDTDEATILWGVDL